MHLNKKKFACGIFINLKKAFDTVSHEILLKHCGIMEEEDWFKSYLTKSM